MATTPPLPPSIAAATTSRMGGWIQQLSKSASARTDALSPQSTPENRPSLKRKRATSSVPCAYTMWTRNTNPKRPRCDTDTEVLPIHGVSAAGVASNASALILNERNTFSPPSSQAGTRSPRRANTRAGQRLDTGMVAGASRGRLGLWIPKG